MHLAVGVCSSGMVSTYMTAWKSTVAVNDNPFASGSVFPEIKAGDVVHLAADPWPYSV